ACRGGRKVPYSGPYPERFNIRIHTDDPDGVGPLKHALRDAGFPRVDVMLGDTDDLNRGYALHWGAAAKEPDIESRLRQVVRGAMMEVGAGPPFELSVSDHFAAEDPDVWVYFPVRGLDDGTLLARLSDPGRFKLTLHTPDPGGWSDLLGTWEKWGFQ